jgi:hypothetical protein
MRTGRQYIGNSPSKKSVAKIKENVGNLRVPSNVAPWEEVCEKLNRKLRGLASILRLWCYREGVSRGGRSCL